MLLLDYLTGRGLVGSHFKIKSAFNVSHSVGPRQSGTIVGREIQGDLVVTGSQEAGWRLCCSYD